MQCAHVSEAETRDLVRSQILARPDPPAMIVEEFWLPTSNRRADVAVLGPFMEGIELKTHRDSLERLPEQATAYGSVFDRCTLVSAERHLAAAEKLLPGWWGLVRIPADRGGSLEVVRPAERNPSVDTSILVRLLWKEEARSALLGLGVSVEASRGRGWMWQELQSRASESQVRALVRCALAERDPATARIPTKRFRPLAEVGPTGSSPPRGGETFQRHATSLGRPDRSRLSRTAR